MTHIEYKSDRERLNMESGNVKQKLVNILKLGIEWASIEYPNYETFTITGVHRTQKEQDDIYGNNKDKKLAAKYKRKPWPSVHMYWRGLDIRTKDMPRGMAKRLTEFFNMIRYDKKRPKKKTAILHNVGKGNHIHLQIV